MNRNDNRREVNFTLEFYLQVFTPEQTLGGMLVNSSPICKCPFELIFCQYILRYSIPSEQEGNKFSNKANHLGTKCGTFLILIIKSKF